MMKMIGRRRDHCHNRTGSIPCAPLRIRDHPLGRQGKYPPHSPGGRVEFIGAELRKLPKPDRTDDRAFYMNTAINGLSKEGFEVVAMTSDEVILKRPSSGR